MPKFYSPSGNPEIWKEKPNDQYLSEEEWNKLHPVEEWKPTKEFLFGCLRAARNYRISETDYVLMPDYPISSENLTKVKAYRQALRDLPSQEGAPWDGGEENTPWPQNPLVESTISALD